jgi:hypothetical protein
MSPFSSYLISNHVLLKIFIYSLSVSQKYVIADNDLSKATVDNTISVRLKTYMRSVNRSELMCSQRLFTVRISPHYKRCQRGTEIPTHYSVFSITGTWACSRPLSSMAALWRSPLWEGGWTTARPWVNSLKLCWKLPAQRMFTSVKLFVFGTFE